MSSTSHVKGVSPRAPTLNSELQPRKGYVVGAAFVERSVPFRQRGGFRTPFGKVLRARGQGAARFRNLGQSSRRGLQVQFKAKRSRVSGTVCLHLFANLLRYFLGCKADSASVLGEGTLRSNPISHHPGDRQSLHCRYMVRILYRRSGGPKQGRKVKLESTSRASFPSYFCLLCVSRRALTQPPNPKP